MALLRKKRRRRFPTDMLRWLEKLGRYTFDVQHSGIDGSDMWDRIGPLYAYATDDRDAFLTELRAVVSADRDGFATFGAACLVWEMYGSEALDEPGALPLIDGGITFKLARGAGSLRLTVNEQIRLDQTARDRAELPDVP
ncbi:hypothetical protein [Luedemannella helvata]